MARLALMSGLGSAAVIAGLAKIQQHLALLSDPLALAWCGPGRASVDPSMVTVLGHCWGCYAAAVGVGILAYAGWDAATSQQSKRARPVLR